MINCPICESSATSSKTISCKCVFTNRELKRIRCESCGLIFGPEYMLSATPDFIESEYKKLYETYSEGDTTKYGVQTFFDMTPGKDLEYLEYGCGKWSRTTEDLLKKGYKIKAYEPYAKPSHGLLIDNLSNKKFDGIFSHNVIEHLLDPVATFREFSKLLNLGGKMAHSTACYDYLYEMSQFHIFFFLGKSIEKLCERTGFVMLGKKSYPDYKCCIFELAHKDI